MSTEWTQQAGMAGDVDTDNVQDFAESAQTAATNAATSETNAASSASSAATSASNASTSATNATTSATQAASSASNAATSATSASNSAASAAGSATDANTHKLAALAAQAAAEAAQSQTEDIFDQFGDQYLGSKASDPTVDNDGDPLTTGDIYWNSTTNTLRFYNGTAWVAPETIATTAATAAQAAQAAAEAAYDSFDDRYLGSKASNPSVDNDGNALLTGALYYNSTENEMRVYTGSVWIAVVDLAGDVTVTSLTASSVDINGGTIDGVTIGGASAGAGTFTGFTLDGDATFTGASYNVTWTKSANQLLVRDNAQIAFGNSADLRLYHNGSNSFIDDAGTGDLYIRAASNLFLGKYTGETLAAFTADGASSLYYDNALKLATTATGIDVTGTVTADGLISSAAANISGGGWGILPYVANSFVVDSVSGQTRLFATGTDASTHGNMLFFTSTTNGTASERLRIDSSGNVGIGTSTIRLGERLHVLGQGIVTSSAENTNMAMFGTFGTNEQLIGSFNNIPVVFRQHNTERMRIDSSGNVGIGTASPASKLHVASSTTSSILKISNSTTGSAIGDGLDLIIDGLSGYVWNRENGPLLFATNNTERLRILANGNVGIGTSSPANMLHLSNTSEGTHDLAFNRNTTYGTSTGLGGVSWYNQAGDTKLTRIESQTDGAATYTRLIFSTASSGTLTEKMRITSTGNVGIGTTSPATIVHLVETDASDEPTLLIQSENSSIYLRTAGSSGSFPSGGGGNDGELLYLGGDFRVGIGDASKNLIFMNGSSYAERARIDSSGRLLVGTTAAKSLLTVGNSTSTASSTSGISACDNVAGDVTLLTMYNQSQDASATAIIEGRLGQASNANTAAGKIIFGKEGNWTNTASTRDGYIAFTTALNAGFIERLRITSTGNLGIGTSSPSARLHVNDGSFILSNSTTTDLTITGGTGNQCRIFFGDSGSSTQGRVAYDNSTDSLQVDTNGTERMRITSAGNVGIGTTSPSAKLQVTGTATVTGLTTLGSATETPIQIDRLSDSISYGLITLNGALTNATAAGIIGKGTGGDAGNLYYTSPTAHVWQIAATERMRLNSSGQVGIGTSSPSARLQIQGMAAGEQALLIEAERNDPLSNGLVRINITDNVCPFAGLQIDHAGTGAAIIANGKVGIGTSSPVARLDVENSSAKPFGTAAQLNAVFKGSVAIGEGGSIGFDYFGSHTNAPTSIGYAIESQTGLTKGSLVFGTRSVTTDTAPTERMRIDSSGNVGIGNTSSGYVLTSGEKRLTVGDGAEHSAIQLYSGTGKWGAIAFSDDTANEAGQGFIGYYHPDNYMQFNTNGTERLRINSSGSVGIGTIPNAGMTALTALQLGYGGGFQSHASSTNSIYVLSNAYYDGAWKYKNAGAATEYKGINGEHIWETAASGSANGALTWSERMRIDSSGNLLVGTTTGTGAQLRVNTSQSSCSIMQNSNASPNGLQIAYSNVLNSVGNEFLFCNETTNTRMTVRSNGGIANYSANDVNLSDRREKTNFAPAKSYLDTICSIPVQTFNYIDQNMEEDPGLTLGVVAQDVQEVAPEFVMESNWGTEENPKMRLSIYQTDLQYALMKCIQELKAENDALKSRLDTAGL
jgi:hypothetical protein